MSLSVPPSMPAAETQTTALLSAERDCTWSARTGATWLTVAPTTGQGTATLTVAAAENPQGRVRSAAIEINQQQFTVVQAGQPCRYEVTPAAVAVPHQGGRVAIRLTTLDGCSWTTQSSASWLRVVVGSGGDTGATLDVAVDSNSGPERSAVLTVATATVSVNQAAGPDDRSECQRRRSACRPRASARGAPLEISHGSWWFLRTAWALERSATASTRTRRPAIARA
jgi:hypothetical protein